MFFVDDVVLVLDFFSSDVEVLAEDDGGRTKFLFEGSRGGGEAGGALKLEGGGGRRENVVRGWKTRLG